tara:strand:+ start:1133 stop:1264 length:132 start_codon:yes stop_codon:yes gene_type:complete
MNWFFVKINFNLIQSAVETLETFFGLKFPFRNFAKKINERRNC